MADRWQEITSRFERVSARLKACAPDDRPRLRAVLKERRAIVEQLAVLVRADPGGASPLLLERLKAASEAGQRYTVRLRLQAEWLRRQLAAETSHARLLHCFAAPASAPRRRLSLRS